MSNVMVMIIMWYDIILCEPILQPGVSMLPDHAQKSLLVVNILYYYILISLVDFLEGVQVLLFTYAYAYLLLPHIFVSLLLLFWSSTFPLDMNFIYYSWYILLLYILLLFFILLLFLLFLLMCTVTDIVFWIFIMVGIINTCILFYY